MVWINFLFLCSDLQAVPLYGVCISQLKPLNRTYSGLLKSYSNRSTNVYCPIVRFIPSVITNELSGMILSLLRSSVNDTIIRNYILQEIRPSNMSRDSALCPVRGSQCLTDVFGFLCKVVIMRFLSLDLFFFFPPA